MEFFQISKPMPPKRDAASPTMQPPAKVIKIDPQTDSVYITIPNYVEDGGTLLEGPTYSPTQFVEHETGDIGLEENCGSPGIQTDTISLLMKIDQLLEELIHERRCRILAENELMELKGDVSPSVSSLHTVKKTKVYRKKNTKKKMKSRSWLKDQFLRAAPVSGGIGEFLMRRMGWQTGEGLGRNHEGIVEPITVEPKFDRKGLVAEGETPLKKTGGLVNVKRLMGKHPVCALSELCLKKRIMYPDFVMVDCSFQNFLFKVTVNGVDYQPQSASPNKKHAKAMAATVALQAMLEVPADGVETGHTGPVFTAASTGPLFAT